MFPSSVFLAILHVVGRIVGSMPDISVLLDGHRAPKSCTFVEFNLETLRDKFTYLREEPFLKTFLNDISDLNCKRSVFLP